MKTGGSKNAPVMAVREDPIVYVDGVERRTIDLRPYGVDAIPLVGISNYRMVRGGTEYHVHPGCVEVCLCLRGNLRFEADGQQYPFLPGRVFVSNCNEPHRMRSNPKGLALYRLLFALPSPGKAVLGLTLAETQWLVRSLTHFPVRLFPASPRVKSGFAQVLSIYDEKPKGVDGRLRLRTSVIELLLAIIESPQLPPEQDVRPQPKVREIVARMQASPEREYPVESLAAEAALSTVAFNEAFKRATGLPPHAFLLGCRLENSRQELERGKVSVATVALKFGFCSARHFSTAFKRMFGVCPSKVAGEGVV